MPKTRRVGWNSDSEPEPPMLRPIQEGSRNSMHLDFDPGHCLLLVWEKYTRSVVMATERIDDLRAFRDFVDAQLENGGSSLTPEECLDLWIIENSSDEEREEALAAIRQGLEDMYAGRTCSAREAIAELRRKHKLPELS
jgi:hypothetical protein